MRSERQITDWLRSKAIVPPGSRVVLGIGDDCAIYRPKGSAEDLLFTTDLFLEDIHFRRTTHTAADVGRVAMCRSLSDIAAMGGEPRFALVSLCIPAWASVDGSGVDGSGVDGSGVDGSGVDGSNDNWVRKFFTSLTATAGKAGAVLAGGDLSHGPTLACDVMVCGAVPKGKALRRDGARPGHILYVTGRLGGSALGLETGKGRAWRRHTHPEPRLEVGRYLRETLKASSCMDLSDGISLDLKRLCLASGVSAEITDPPLFPGATLHHGLHGGEEYELLFTAPPRTTVPATIAGVPISQLGVIVPGQAAMLTHCGRPLPSLAYDHFASAETPMK